MASPYLSFTKSNKITEAVLELHKLNSEFKDYKSNFENQKEKLQNKIKDYTDKNNLEEFGIESKLGMFKIRPVINKKIIWDIDKLSGKLDKEILNEITDKQYTINDMDGLITYLKSCGVNPRKFKEFLNIDKKINDKKVDELCQLGDITENDITGCYEVQANFSYIKISELEQVEE